MKLRRFQNNDIMTMISPCKLCRMGNLNMILILLFALYFSSCFKETVFEEFPKQTRNLFINNKKCALNEDDNSFYYAISNRQRDTLSAIFTLPIDWESVTFNGQKLSNNLVTILYNLELNTPYDLKVELVSGTQKDFTIEFVNIPVFEIFTNEEIRDEEKIYSQTIINFPETNLSEPQVIISGIEIRGGTSTAYPKKSYALEFYLDSLDGERNKVSLGDLRNDDDWILDAMYIDKARMRNRVSFDIWNEMSEQSNYNAYSGSKNGIDGCFVLLFINNQLMGFYALNEKIDKKQLKIREEFNSWGGYLYKATSWGNRSVAFDSVLNYLNILSVWEVKYPKNNLNDKSHWEQLDKLIDFVVNSSDDEFKDNIHTYINIRNFADYFILLNTMQGIDNWGKNTFLYKFDENYPFHIAPWDMDGTWGRSWNSKAYNWNQIYTNSLYNRLLVTDACEFNLLIRNLWNGYRKDQLSIDSIFAHFMYYNDIINQNGLVQKENLLWEQDLNINQEITYIESWLETRLGFLDAFFNQTKPRDKFTYYGYSRFKGK